MPEPDPKPELGAGEEPTDISTNPYFYTKCRSRIQSQFSEPEKSRPTSLPTRTFTPGAGAGSEASSRSRRRADRHLYQPVLLHFLSFITLLYYLFVLQRSLCLSWNVLILLYNIHLGNWYPVVFVYLKTEIWYTGSAFCSRQICSTWCWDEMLNIKMWRIYMIDNSTPVIVNPQA